VLLFLIECTDPNPQDSLRQLQTELKQFNPDLMEKSCLILKTKMDLDQNQEISDKWKSFPGKVVEISSVTHSGLDSLVDAIAQQLNED
jgi:GTP-binding protein